LLLEEPFVSKINAANLQFEEIEAAVYKRIYHEEESAGVQ
jgi:hypothetical protein